MKKVFLIFLILLTLNNKIRSDYFNTRFKDLILRSYAIAIVEVTKINVNSNSDLKIIRKIHGDFIKNEISLNINEEKLKVGDQFICLLDNNYNLLTYGKSDESRWFNSFIKISNSTLNLKKYNGKDDQVLLIDFLNNYLYNLIVEDDFSLLTIGKKIDFTELKKSFSKMDFKIEIKDNHFSAVYLPLGIKYELFSKNNLIIKTSSSKIAPFEKAYVFSEKEEIIGYFYKDFGLLLYEYEEGIDRFIDIKGDPNIKLPNENIYLNKLSKENFKLINEKLKKK